MLRIIALQTPRSPCARPHLEVRIRLCRQRAYGVSTLLRGRFRYLLSPKWNYRSSTRSVPLLNGNSTAVAGRDHRAQLWSTSRTCYYSPIGGHWTETIAIFYTLLPNQRQKIVARRCWPHTGTTNGLRHGTQFGVPIREYLVTVCVGYVAMRVRWRSACHVVAKVLKCLNNFSKLSRLVTTKLLSADAWHWVSRISRTVRNLCVSEWVVS